MAKKKSKKRAAVRRSTQQPDERSAPPPRLDRPRHGSEPNPFASPKKRPDDEVKPPDEGALTREVISECRINLAQLQEAGELLDRMYSREALAERRALYFKRKASPKEVEYDVTGPDGSKRRVRRAADYGGDSWACQQEWPSEAEPTKQLMNRLFAALNDVMGGWFHCDLRPTVDSASASIVLSLHWVLSDEFASSLKPQVCEFQLLPWFTGKTMLGRRTVARVWFTSAQKGPWFRRVKEALDWARIDPDWRRASMTGVPFAQEVADGEGAARGSTKLSAAQLNAAEKALLIALERARRENPPRALGAKQLRLHCAACSGIEKQKFRDDAHVQLILSGLRKRGIEIPNPRNKSGYSLATELKTSVPDLAKAIE